MIHLSNISKQFGDRILFKDAGFQINPGEKIGLVGPNGAGKTTIFRLITGEESVDSGQVNIPNRLRVAYFSQNVGDMRGSSALEEVKSGAGRVSELARHLADYEKQLEDSAVNPISDEAMAALLEKYGDVQHEFEQSGGYDLDSRAKEVLTGLGISPRDHHLPLDHFSGGWKMRIALAKVLVFNPDALLMDEPTNYLDLESIIWLEEWLRQFKGALVMTSHDREFLNRVVTKIVEIAHQKITVYSGNYDFYDRERQVRLDQLVAAHKRQQDMLAKEEEFIARFAARASHAAQVQSRVKKLEKIERVEIPAEQQVMDFEFAQTSRSGNEVVKLENLGKTWKRQDGSAHLVFSGANGMIRRQDRVAVVGVNGAGKSTLLKVICDLTEASEGKSTLGANVHVGYFSQHSLDVLNPQHTVFEEVQSRIPKAAVGFIRNLLGAFLFSGDDADKKISVLSGGEKSRVVLATILANPVNFLVLDEPTNHLDIKSREILLSALKKFDGTLAFVSHDRFFLKAVANRVFQVGLGELRVFEGDYDYYLSKTGH